MFIFSKRRPVIVRGFRTNDLIECLERRIMLSAAVAPVVHTVHYDSHIIHTADGAGVIPGFTPSQTRKAYGFDQVSFSGGSVTADGAGQTIAIVDAFNNPNIVSDLAVFDAAFSLSAPPNFSIINQTGGTTLPANDSGWGGEIALDVEWAHAMAPQANIILVEATSAEVVDMVTAVNFARNLPNVSVVSMSWGGSEFESFGGVEFTNQTQLDAMFTTPAGHQGITFIASAGDTSVYEGSQWPSTSPNVLSIGGTSLYTTDAAGTYSGEASWFGTSGGVSLFESAPSYQAVAAPGQGVRITPDVSYNADPATGFAVYDTFVDPGSPPQTWIEVVGTSAGAPQWASLIAIANQGRSVVGKPSLDGASGTLPTLYSVYSGPTTSAYTTVYKNYYNDVIDDASNRFLSRADAGYDDLTGLGTPKVPAIVTLLGGAADTGLGGGNNAVAANLPASQVSGALLTNPPAFAFVGSSGSIKMRVVNNGRAFSGDIIITVFASTQTSLDAGATAIGTITLKKQNLKLGGNRTLKVSLNFPSNMADGTYFIIATTNTVGTNTSPIDSLAPKSIKIARRRADLAASFAGGKPIAVIPGRMTTADLIVQNVGTVKTTGLWDLTLYASLDLLIDGSDAVVAQLTSKRISLAPGRSIKIRVRFMAPAGLTPGSYKLIAATTNTLQPVDGNLSNNIATVGTR